jgi:MacB-like periplasmic core domain
MLQDLRLGLRTLARTPLFTALAVTLLALGVGAAIAVFSLVDGVLLKALPYPDPDRIMTVWEATDRSRTIGVSAPNFRDWHGAATSFDALAAWSGGRATVIGGREPVVTGVYGVTREFFAALGVGPMLGRTFTADETRENGTPAVVVSHGFWERVLGASRDLNRLGLDVDGRPAAVVGVLPPGFARRRGVVPAGVGARHLGPHGPQPARRGAARSCGHARHRAGRDDHNRAPARGRLRRRP